MVRQENYFEYQSPIKPWENVEAALQADTLVNPEYAGLFEAYPNLQMYIGSAGKKSKDAAERVGLPELLADHAHNQVVVINQHEMRPIAAGAQSLAFLLEIDGKGFIYKTFNDLTGNPKLFEDYRKEMLRTQQLNAELAPKLVDQDAQTTVRFAKPVYASFASALYEYEYGYTPLEHSLERYVYPLELFLEDFIDAQKTQSPQLWGRNSADIINVDFSLRLPNFIFSDHGQRKEIICIDPLLPEAHRLGYLTPTTHPTPNYQNELSFTEATNNYSHAMLELQTLQNLWNPKQEDPTGDTAQRYLSAAGNIIGKDLKNENDFSYIHHQCKLALLKKYKLKYFLRYNSA